MKRYPYDLSSYSAVVGRIGRLMTVQCIPVVANDTMAIDVIGALRLSPLRQVLSLDAKVDVFSFYVPHRHVYGSDWQDFIQGGYDGSVTLDTITPSGTTSAIGFLPIPNATVPKAVVSGYAKIWNEYFKVPLGDVADMDEDALNVNDKNFRLFGKPVAKLPTYFTTGIDSSVYQSDEHRTIDITAGTPDSFDLIDLKTVQAQFKTEVDRDYFGQRYRDVMSKSFGAGQVSTDADQRPELLNRSTSWLSGYDVDGTGSGNLGDYVGKAQGMIRHQVPPRYFKEHGMVWIMICLRFPAITEDETHYLNKKVWTYENVSGDPSILASQPPHELTVADLAETSKTTSLGYHAYGQWYRTQPNNIHPTYESVAGFPFGKMDSNDFDPYYCDDTKVDYFGSNKLSHFQLVSKVNVEAKRIVPPTSTSMYAGA